MAAKQYGTTLWGGEFLKAIERSTDSGRLSRGKTYANTGKVYAVALKKHTITAKVKGNYSPFYSTSMAFNGFSDLQKKLIIDFIDENPLVLASIMKGTLPPELLSFATNHRMKLFEGFNMNCNCFDFYADYACKHIAGLYYMLVNEIDKNPFILLTLRGLDLIEHYGIEEDLSVSYPLEIQYLNDEIVNDFLKEISLLKFDDFKNFILSMLSDNPPFAHVDYKEVLAEFYTKTSKELPLIISPIYSENIDKIQRILQESDITFEMDKDIYGGVFKIKNPLLKDENVLAMFDAYKMVSKNEELIMSTNKLFNLFVSFEDDTGSGSYTYLFYLFRVAYILLEKSGFIPAVVESKNDLSIVYKPLESISSIYEQLNSLSFIAPKMVMLDKKYLSQRSGTSFLISAIISDFVPLMGFMHKKQKNNPPAISYTFFDAKKLKTKEFEYQSLAYTISNYFGIFEIIKSEYSYKIFIDKEDENYSIEIKVKDKISQKELSLSKSLNLFNKMQILKFLSFLNEFLPQLHSLVNQDKVFLPESDLEQFLLKTSTIISNLGVEIILPKELKNLLKPKLSLSVKSSSKSLKSFFTLDGMLEYDWQLSIGDVQISFNEFEELVKGGKELIRFKDNFVVITPEEAKAMFAQMNKKAKLNKFDILQAKLSDDAFFDADLEQFFDDIFTPKDVAIPLSLQADLREYQVRGFRWNINNLLNGFGSILADDMGLGKTIQAITTLLYLKENGYIKENILVVVPTSLLNNWEKELQKFAPSLSCFSFYGAKRVMQKADVIITTYDLVRRELELFKKQKIDCLIIDEAQKIKNPTTEISKAVKSLKAKYKIALSGTPVENNLSELWSIFDFSLPKYLKTLKDFIANYAKDIEIHKDLQKVKRLKKITAPFMLRRLKIDKDIISDLPKKIVIDEYATMTKTQASLYQSVVDETMEQIEQTSDKGLVFKLIISLKQICNHPRNFDKISQNSAALSGKTELLLTLLENIMIQDEKVLIFTQYTQMGDMLVELIQKELLTTPLYLHGSMTKKQRDETVELFQTDNRYKIFILSLKAGGVGLNLTAANHVVHYDLWFNPAVENQATDRAFRIGQEKNVTVHRLITQNSFEEKIDKMIKSKQELSDLSVNIGESWLKDMDKDELRDLFRQ